MNDEKRCFHSIRSAIHFPSVDIDCSLNAIVYPLCLFRRFIDIHILLTIPNAFPYRQSLKEERRVSLRYSNGSTRLFIFSYCLSYRFLFFDKIDTEIANSFLHWLCMIISILRIFYKNSCGHVIKRNDTIRQRRRFVPRSKYYSEYSVLFCHKRRNIRSLSMKQRGSFNTLLEYQNLNVSEFCYFYLRLRIVLYFYYIIFLFLYISCYRSRRNGVMNFVSSQSIVVTLRVSGK